MDADCGCDYFDLPISEVLLDQHLGISECHVHRAGNIYCQDRIYPLINSKQSLENVTKLMLGICPQTS